VHVVTRNNNNGVINKCLQLNIPYTIIDSNGLGESIAQGVKETSNWDGWLIHLADMPFINSDIFIQMAEALKKWPLVRPIYKGLPGHPVGISANYYHNLINLSGDEGAKSILRNNSILELDINDSNVVKDIDYPLFNSD